MKAWHWMSMELMKLSSVIESGKIIRNKGSSKQEDMPYEMAFIDESYLCDIMALQDVIIHNLSDKEIFRTHPEAYFEDHLKVDNSVIGIFTSDGLVAYNVLYFPGMNEDNFGSDIGLSSDELDKVVHLATVAVHPAYRGNSLQKRMEGFHLKMIQEIGDGHVCCMVSPKNRHSLQNILSNGLVIKALKIKFDQRLRFIMHKDLSRPSIIGPEEIKINSSNIDGQINLLRLGFMGFRVARLPEGFEIIYGRDCASAI
jgi:hypothetical protein